jgi:import receptor subunit TOM22
MVKLQEVEDEHFSEEQQGPKLEDDDEYVDTDSELSSEDDSDDDDETFEESVYERLVALKDMVPLKHRARVSGAFGATYNAVSSVLRFGGKSLWVLSASAIMLGVPYALAVGEEQQMVEMEKEMKVWFNCSDRCPRRHLLIYLDV